MPESGSALGVENRFELFTFQEILYRFQNYMEREKPGLKRFYEPGESGQYFKDSVFRGLTMTRKLMHTGCPREIAAELSLLALWDLAFLIGTRCPHMFFLCRVLIGLRYTLIGYISSSKMVALTHEI